MNNINNDEEDNDLYNVTIEAGNEFKICENLSGCVHKPLLIKLREKILQNIISRNLDEYKSKEPWEVRAYVRESNYLLTGKRGSGKTTFMKTLVQLLLGKKKYKEETNFPSGRQKPEIDLLCWYDPSEAVGCNDYFFLTIAAALKSKLETAIRKRKQEDNDFNFLIDYCKTSMKKLDKGIVRLSNNRNALEGITPPGAAALRKDNPEFDESIRGNFAAVVDRICEICHVDSFIIAIDDADSRSEQCFNVLEDLRLYISHPRLIVLMTGDKNLLLERIRERLFREYDYKYHKADIRRQETRMDLVIAHTSQYLIKLFPLNNQCELANMQTIMHKNKPIHFQMLFCNKQETGGATYESNVMDLNDKIKEVFKIVISEKDDEVAPYVDLFLRLPLRSILQVLNNWHSNDVWVHLESYKKLKGRPDKAPSTCQEEIIYAVKMSMKRVLEDELSSSYYNFESLDADDGRTFYSIMLKHCQNTGDLEHGYFLAGGVGLNDEERYITMLLATSFKGRVKCLDDYITYMLYGPATVSLFTRESFNLKNNWTEQASLSSLSEAFNNYMQVGRGISPSRWARHANVIFSRTGNHAGVQKLTKIKLHGSPNEETEEETSTERIRDKLFATEKHSLHATATRIAILASLSRTAPDENAYLISIYSYIAFILRCCQACHAMTSVGDYQHLIDLFKEYEEIKSCLYPSWHTKKEPEKNEAKNPTEIKRIEFSINSDTLLNILATVPKKQAANKQSYSRETEKILQLANGLWQNVEDLSQYVEALLQNVESRSQNVEHSKQIIQQLSEKAKELSPNAPKPLRKEKATLQILEELSKNAIELSKEAKTLLNDTEDFSNKAKALSKKAEMLLINTNNILIANRIYTWYTSHKENFSSPSKLTPHSIADAWSSLYYNIERIYSQNKDSNQLTLFRKAIKVFLDKTGSGLTIVDRAKIAKGEQENTTEHFMSMIGDFPLNAYLLQASVAVC